MFGQLYFEIKLQSFISHPNALKMYGYFQDEKNIYLLLELASHSCMFRELKSKVK
jgi:serine/threonine protein kinase